MATAPANTLPAFGAALVAGATALESDLWLAADMACRCSSHGRPRGPVPALADLFAAHGTAYDLSLDVPDRRAAQAAVDVALAAGHDPRRLWLCGGHDRVGGWRDVHPDVRLVADARVLHTLPGRVVPLRRLAAAGVDALNLRRTRWGTGPGGPHARRRTARRSPGTCRRPPGSGRSSPSAATPSTATTCRCWRPPRAGRLYSGPARDAHLALTTCECQVLKE